MGQDIPLHHARQIVCGAVANAAKSPLVTGFFDEGTNTVSYVVQDSASRACSIIDSVLDFDLASGRMDTKSVDLIMSHVRRHALEVQWDFETHVHADHLSAAPIIGSKTGAALA